MDPINVLIADDHQIVLDGILSFLDNEKEIKVVQTAKNGIEVLDHLQHERVDVAVLDIHMPEMDGLETARKVLRQYPKTKIIFLTMTGESQFIINALKVGVHGYVTKEKSKEYLVGAIHSVYRGASYWSPEILSKIANAKELEEPEFEAVSLTRREEEVLCMLVDFPAYTSEDIGRELCIAKVTVDTHIRNMKAKVKARRRGELIRYAMDNKICQK